jgi:hypothetical protein
MDEPENKDIIIAEPAQAEVATTAPPTTSHTPVALVAGVICLLVSLLIYVLRLDRIIGMFVDDAWYVLLAKALATGQGYTLLNSPSPGILPLYPPAFPFLLSLVYRLSPSFPDNLQLLKSVSIVAMLGAGVVAYRYFLRERELPWFLALGLATAMVLSPPLVFLATSTVMSECVFTLVFLLTIWVSERCVRAGKSGQAWRYAVLCGALAAVAFLTRSVAIGLIAAVFIYLLKERLVRPALIFVLVVGALTGPWIIYSQRHAPTLEQQREQGGYIVQPYSQQFWQRQAGASPFDTVGVKDLPARVWNNSVLIAGRDVGRIVFPLLYEMFSDPMRGATKQGEGFSGGTWFPSFILSILVMLGFVSVVRQKLTSAELAVPLSLAITVLWPWDTFRLVLPVLPFLLFYFLMGCRAIYQFYQQRRGSLQPRAQWAVLGVLIASILALNLYANVYYISRKLSNSPLDRPVWLRAFDELEVMLKWIDRELPKEYVIATPSPPLINLYTGHKTLSAFEPTTNWANWNRLNVRYVARTIIFDAPEPFERQLKTIYRSSGEQRFRVIDLGPPAERPVLGTGSSSAPVKPETNK